MQAMKEEVDMRNTVSSISIVIFDWNSRRATALIYMLLAASISSLNSLAAEFCRVMRVSQLFESLTRATVRFAAKLPYLESTTVQLSDSRPAAQTLRNICAGTDRCIATVVWTPD